VRILQSLTRQVVILLLTGAVFASSGCGSGDNTQLRVMDATPQESEIDVSLDGNSFASDVAYGTDSSYSSVSSGSHTLQVYPPGVATAYIDQTISLTSGDKYTVLSANVLASAGLGNR
jgi:hypothetical protein